MSECIFCKIVQGEIPCNKVYEDEKVLAFYDINPRAKIHILVISKDHIESHNDINETNANIIANMHLAINKIANELGFAGNGYRVINNCLEDGGQDVMHIHFHILAGEKLESQN